MSKADFIIPLYEFCKKEGLSFRISYVEVEDMFYDLYISSYPEGDFFYKKRPCYFDEELKAKILMEAEKLGI